MMLVIKMNNYESVFSKLSSNDYHEVGKISDNLINDAEFIKRIITISNPFIFDRFMKMIEYKMDTSPIYEERNKYIKKILLNLNNNSFNERWITEYIIGYYFQDNYYNFMTNFYQMLRYLEYSKKDLISKENIGLYKEFVDLRNMSLKDKIEFFKLLLDDIDVMGTFYDDMKTVREDSHKELVNKALKLNHDSKIYNIDISKRLNIDVYFLDGEEFYGFVRCLSISSNDMFDNYKYVNSINNNLGDSFSYIGNHNIGTIDYLQSSVALFYDNIDYKNIMYVHRADLHSKRMNIQDDYLTEKENEIVTPNSLIANTNNYNEIYIKHGVNGIKPTALICYDTITSNDIDFARKYGLSILVINRRKYKRFDAYDEYDDYSYVI